MLQTPAWSLGSHDKSKTWKTQGHRLKERIPRVTMSAWAPRSPANRNFELA